MTDGIIKILDWFQEHPMTGLLILGAIASFRLFTIRITEKKEPK